MSDSNSELAAELKDEANKLFANKEFSQAYDKYSKAIKVGGENAILYANRSACCMALGRFLDARSDARKSINIDPTYAKGWGRLGYAEQELGSWDRVVEAYEKGLSCLPKEGLSAAEAKQKEKYEAAIRNAKKKIESSGTNLLRMQVRDGDYPWDRAKMIIETIEANGAAAETWNTSAATILMAYGDFIEASRGLNQMREVRMPNGEIALHGRLDVIDKYSNAILSDRRVCTITDPGWIEKYNKQVTFQSKTQEAWPDAGANAVLDEAQQRVAKFGWSKTRPALSVTVRAWIIRGHLSGGLHDDWPAAVQFFSNAVDVLQRGRAIWADVPSQERGDIFHETFIISVRARHLDAYRQALAISQGDDPRFSAEKLDSLAIELFKDASAARRAVGDRAIDNGISFFLAYYIYPAAEAISVAAFCKRVIARGKPIEERSQLWGESASLYWKAAQLYPEDDELHIANILSSLGSWWRFDDLPIRTVLPLLEKLKESVPKMRKIWEFSSFAAEGRDAQVKKCLDFYEEIQEKMKNGETTAEQVYNPPFSIS